MSDNTPVPNFLNDVWRLKRLHQSADKNAANSFLKLVLGLKGNDLEQFSGSAFSSIFDNYSQNIVVYSKKTREKEQKQFEESFKKGTPRYHPQVVFYKSDILSLFYEIFTDVLKIKKGEFGNEKAKTLLEIKNDDSKLAKISGLKTNLIEDFYSFLSSYEIPSNYIISDNEAQFPPSLLKLPKLKILANYILYLLKTRGSEDATEKDKKPDDSESGDTAQPDEAQAKTKSSTSPVPQEETVGVGDGSQPQTAQVTSPKQIPTLKEKSLSEKLIDPEFRRQVGLLTNLSLMEYERIYDIPKGVLANSDMRELFAEKSVAFMLTALSEGRANNLSDPAERHRLFYEYMTFTGGDLKIVNGVLTHLNQSIDDLRKEFPEKAKAIEDFLEGKTKVDADGLKNYAKKLAEANISDSGGSHTLAEYIQNKSEQNLDSSGLGAQALTILEKQLGDAGVPPEHLSFLIKKINENVKANQKLGKPIEFFTKEFGQTLQNEYPLLKNDNFENFLEAYYYIKAENVNDLKTQFGSTKEALDYLENLSLEQRHEITLRPQENFSKNFPELQPKEFNYLERGLESDLPSDEDLHRIFTARATKHKQDLLNTFRKNLNQEDFSRTLVFYGVSYEDASIAYSDASYVLPSVSTNEISSMDWAPGYAAPGEAGTFSSPEVFARGDGKEPILNSPMDSVQRLHALNKRNKKSRISSAGKKLFNKFSKSGAGKEAKKLFEKGMSAAGAAAGSALAGPIGTKIGAMLGSEKGRKKLAWIGLGVGGGIVGLIAWIKRGGGLFGSGAASAAGGLGKTAAGGQSIMGAREGSSATSAQTGQTTQGQIAGANQIAQANQAAAQAAQSTQASALKSAMTTTGVQAVSYTIGGLMVGTFLIFNIYIGAFLADFRQLETLSTIGINGKQSQYVTVEKRVFLKGCPDNHCENPSFPIEAEYSIIISTKGNYTVYIKNLVDEIQIYQNDGEDGWNGSTPNPTPPNQDLSQYIDNTIGPGEKIEISYTQTFGDKFNHSSIINTVTADIYYVDPDSGEEGIDSAITGEVFYVGNSSRGAGCWPTSGTITQTQGLADSSHHKSDAFDIANGLGTNIYAPFAGTASIGSVDSGYGNHVVLSSSEGSFIFAHMSSIMFSGSRQVQAGEIIGKMGSTGNSTGSHLHFERQCDGKYWYSCSGISQANSALGRLMPDGNTIKNRSAVRSCYD